MECGAVAGKWSLAVVIRRIGLGVALGAVLVSGGVAQFPQPSGRYAHMMAYDTARECAVMYGGGTNIYWPQTALNDTWEYRAQSWQRVNTLNSPPACGHGDMVFDSFRNVAVMFGGVVGPNTGHGQTWEYNGVDWALRTSQGPSPRYHHAMAYDPLRRRTVLFGGGNDYIDLGDTWEWDGLAWSPISTVSAPSGRRYHRMVYDNALAKVVLFGGTTGGAETWTWDGQVWAQIATLTAPPPRIAHGMVALPAGGQVLMYGGYSTYNPQQPYLGDAWLFNGSGWTVVSSLLAPVARQIEGGMCAQSTAFWWPCRWQCAARRQLGI